MSNSTLRASLDMMRAIKRASAMKVGRNFQGFFADRILQAGTRPTLAAFMEHLAQSVDVSVEYVGGDNMAAFMRAASADDAPSVLQWLRQQPRLAAMVCMLKEDQGYGEAVESIVLPDGVSANGTAAPRGDFDVQIEAECLSSLAHGSDVSAGNATMFRRTQVVSDTDAVLELPFYAGNAVRGQMRDLLADHFLSSLGLEPSRANPPIALWFFHCLYAGGVLEEGGEASKALGRHGAMKIDGVAQLRSFVPPLSLLGVALGNRILSGRVNVADWRPRCHEWGNGERPVAELMGWEYLTRREDHEGRDEEAAHHGMIATAEVLVTGTRLEGGIDLHPHITDTERACLAQGLALLQGRGVLGAQSRRGFGQVSFSVDDSELCPQADYEQYLSDNRQSILDYLGGIGAFN